MSKIVSLLLIRTFNKYIPANIICSMKFRSSGNEKKDVYLLTSNVNYTFT